MISSQGHTCTWLIEANGNNAISLNMLEFNTPSEEDCVDSSAYLEVTNTQ